MARKRDLAKGLAIGLVVCTAITYVLAKLTSYADYLEGRGGGVVVDVLSLLLTYYGQREWLLLLNSTLLIGVCLFALPVFFCFLLYLCVKRSRWNVSIGGGIVLVLFGLSSWFVLISVRAPRYQSYLRGFTERSQAKLDQTAALAWADFAFTNYYRSQLPGVDFDLFHHNPPSFFTNVYGRRPQGIMMTNGLNQPIAMIVDGNPVRLVILNTNVSIDHEALDFPLVSSQIGPRIYASYRYR